MKNPEWHQRSREQDENVRDTLARKHSISVEDVNTVERFLLTSSQQGRATPWEATMELVGEKYDVGAGTVEKIYLDFQKLSPSTKLKKGKLLPPLLLTEKFSRLDKFFVSEVLVVACCAWTEKCSLIPCQPAGIVKNLVGTRNLAQMLPDIVITPRGSQACLRIPRRRVSPRYDPMLLKEISVYKV